MYLYAAMHVDTLLIIYICVSIGLVCMEIIIDVLLLFFTSTILWLFEYIFVSVTVPQGKEFFFIFHVFIDIHKTLSDNYCVCLCSVIQSSLTLCDPCRAPLSMEFSRQEYWSGLPFPPPGGVADPGVETVSLVSPALAGGFFTAAPPGNPQLLGTVTFCKQ